jgi:hypothetical protein
MLKLQGHELISLRHKLIIKKIIEHRPIFKNTVW